MSRRLRIGIACYPTVGGSGILATELGAVLADRGHEIHFLSYAEPARLKEHPNTHIHTVRVSSYPLFKYPPYDLALTSKMHDLLEHGALDILHVHYAIPHAICSYLARHMLPGCRTKTVLTLHGTDITVVGNEPEYRSITRFGIENTDAVIAVSAYLARETQRIFNPNKNLVVVPNFVDIHRFRPRDSCRLGAEPVVAHMSNFRPVKRPLDVIHAFATIRKTVPARLWLIGDGPELPGCLDLARKLGVGSAVDSLGIVRDVEEVLPNISLLLQPSGSESFGLAALEAMACGVPVVGYRVGGLPEVVIDGETGYLVGFRDTKELAATAARILSDEIEWRRLRSAARERAATLFSKEHAVSEHERIYEALLDAS